MHTLNISILPIYSPFQPNWEIDTCYYIEKWSRNPLTSTNLLYYEFELLEEVSNLLAVVPDGCLDIIFCCDKSQPSGYVFGSVLESTFTPFESGLLYFGVRIPCGYALNTTEFHVKELINSEINVREAFLEGNETIEKIAESDSFSDRIKCFETTLGLKVFNYRKTELLMDYTLNKIINTHGNVSLNQLSRETGYSSRYIRDKYIAHTGIPPKLYSEIVRFQNALKMLTNGKDIFTVIFENGYYDQAHIIHSFTKFNYLTPLEYIKYLKYRNIINKNTN